MISLMFLLQPRHWTIPIFLRIYSFLLMGRHVTFVPFKKKKKKKLKKKSSNNMIKACLMSL